VSRREPRTLLPPGAARARRLLKKLRPLDEWRRNTRPSPEAEADREFIVRGLEWIAAQATDEESHRGEADQRSR